MTKCAATTNSGKPCTCNAIGWISLGTAHTSVPWCKMHLDRAIKAAADKPVPAKRSLDHVNGVPPVKRPPAKKNKTLRAA